MSATKTNFEASDAVFNVFKMNLPLLQFAD
jgi:hypothetical protein